MASLQSTLKQILTSRQINRLAVDAVNQDLRDISLELESEIKTRTPVDTGRLRASMTARETGLLKHEVATNIVYAGWIEFGEVTRRDGKIVTTVPRAMMRKGASEIERRGVGQFRRSARFLNK